MHQVFRIGRLCALLPIEHVPPNSLCLLRKSAYFRRLKPTRALAAVAVRDVVIPANENRRQPKQSLFVFVLKS